MIKHNSLDMDFKPNMIMSYMLSYAIYSPYYFLSHFDLLESLPNSNISLRFSVSVHISEINMYVPLAQPCLLPLGTCKDNCMQVWVTYIW